MASTFNPSASISRYAAPGWPLVSTQPADAILAVLEKLGSVVRHANSYLEVQGAQIYGGFEVDLSWREGELRRVALRGEPGGKAQVRYRETVRTVNVSNGRSVSLNGSHFRQGPVKGVRG